MYRSLAIPFLCLTSALFSRHNIVSAKSLSYSTYNTEAGTVSSLNQTAYLGHWYQMYANLAVDITFENHSLCDSADYGIYPNKTISVFNRERQYNVTGPERQIRGWADTPDPSQPGQLQVHLQTGSGGSDGFPAPYWVYQLGPIGDDGLYRYSIVSDPFKFTLFVLARNVSEFYSEWNELVLDWLDTNGFNTFYNAPIKTEQVGCKPMPN